MKQVVCLKVTPKIEQLKFDEVKKTMIREGDENEINEADKNALEMSLNVKDKLGGQVVVLSMGPPALILTSSSRLRWELMTRFF